jgi:ABC-type glycerol-3-phosphate transport system permease component
VITVYPFAWVLITSFREQADLYANPFGLPSVLHIENYFQTWEEAHIGRYALNSLFVTVMSTALAIPLASMPAYILSRIYFRGRGVIWGYVLMGLMVPQVTTLLTLGIIVRKMGIYDNLLGLAAVYAFGGIPFNVFMLKSFMENIPRELEEAVVLDGGEMWAVYRHVMIPMSLPAIATVATFHALYVWGEYVVSVVFLIDSNKFVLPMGLKNLLGQYSSNFPGYAAGVVLAMIPSIAFFLFFQRYVIKGLSAGALKDISV